MARKFKVGDKVTIKKNAVCFCSTTLRPGLRGRVRRINPEYGCPYLVSRLRDEGDCCLFSARELEHAD